MERKREITGRKSKHHPVKLRWHLTSLWTFLSLGFLSGCNYVSQREYDMMKSSLESKNDMTIKIAVIVCILIAVITLVAGNMMGSKSLKDSRAHQENKEEDNV